MDPRKLIESEQARAPFLLETADESAKTTMQAFQSSDRAEWYEQRAAGLGFSTRRIRWDGEQVAQ